MGLEGGGKWRNGNSGVVWDGRREEGPIE